MCIHAHAVLVSLNSVSGCLKTTYLPFYFELIVTLNYAHSPLNILSPKLYPSEPYNESEAPGAITWLWYQSHAPPSAYCLCKKRKSTHRKNQARRIKHMTKNRVYPCPSGI